MTNQIHLQWDTCIYSDLIGQYLTSAFLNAVARASKTAVHVAHAMSKVDGYTDMEREEERDGQRRSLYTYLLLVNDYISID